MKTRRLFPAGVLLALASTTLIVTVAEGDRAPTKAKPAPAASDKVRAATSDWPAKPREVALKIAAKYGDPDETTASMLIWHQRGPWKRTIVNREEVPHAFPKPHTDIVEQVIDYRVPPDKADELAAYDGSVIVERTKGELSARCDDEKMNFLAINLAHDIVVGSKDVDTARKTYAQTAMAVMAKKTPALTQSFQFKRINAATADPDQPLKLDMAKR
jgi:hypothetical protein